MIDESQRAPSLEGYDTLIILGSKSAVYERGASSQPGSATSSLSLRRPTRADSRSWASALGRKRLPTSLAASCAAPTKMNSGGSRLTSREESNCRPVRGWSFTSTSACLPEVAEVWATTPRAVQAFAIGPHLGGPVSSRKSTTPSSRTGCRPTKTRCATLALTLTPSSLAPPQETPAARVRAQELVDLFLSRAG